MLYEIEHALPTAAPASRWAWIYVAGPVGALIMALADAALVMLASENALLTTGFAVTSVLGIGVTAFVAAYGSGRVWIGVIAAAVASLVAAPLNALVEVGIAVYQMYTPSPADQSGCGCSGPGGMVTWLMLAVILFPLTLCLLRLALSVTIGLLFAWLGVLLSWALIGRETSVTGRRGTAV